MSMKGIGMGLNRDDVKLSSMLWCPINKSATTVATESTWSQNLIRHMPMGRVPPKPEKDVISR